VLLEKAIRLRSLLFQHHNLMRFGYSTIPGFAQQLDQRHRVVAILELEKTVVAFAVGGGPH